MHSNIMPGRYEYIDMIDGSNNHLALRAKHLMKQKMIADNVGGYQQRETTQNNFDAASCTFQEMQSKMIVQPSPQNNL